MRNSASFAIIGLTRIKRFIWVQEHFHNDIISEPYVMKKLCSDQAIQTNNSEASPTLIILTL
jgi:hypothetical protein